MRDAIVATWEDLYIYVWVCWGDASFRAVGIERDYYVFFCSGCIIFEIIIQIVFLMCS